LKKIQKRFIWKIQLQKHKTATHIKEELVAVMAEMKNKF